LKRLILTLALFSTVPATASKTWHFIVPRAGEVGLTIHADAAGTNWAKAGEEAVILTLAVDGKYSQDVTLFMGATPHDYQVLLGPLAAGKHRLDYERNEVYSSTIWGPIAATFKAEVLDDPALAHAPFLYLRANTMHRYSDIPLLCWYEWLDLPAGRTLQFSVIFSNEDGGTGTEALMARWGRTLDVEYVYRWRANGAETYQATNHRDLAFHGDKIGEHPVIFDVSDNNNFSDSGDSPLRIALWPKPFDLSEHSREEIADENPWTYRIMVEELMREEKVAKLGNPRDFLFVEAKIQAATAAASFNVGESKSDRGEAALRINRDGWVRTAILMDSRDVPSLEFRCNAPALAKPESYCVIEAISKVFFLDKEWKPQASLMQWRGPAIRIKPGEGYTFTIPKK
jgi:hypothetical protein